MKKLLIAFLFLFLNFALLSAQGNYEIMLNRPDINGLTGGGTTNLDGIPTTGLTVGTIMLIYDGSETRIYRLSAGTDAEDPPGLVRPDDFASPGNEKVWKVSMSSDPEETGFSGGGGGGDDNDWTRPDNYVYTANTGDYVGIGVTEPAHRLHVEAVE